MSTKHTISVIVPVYKVEDYLDRCVASLVNQTYEDLEIILVDDASPDNCGELCRTWAAKDSRIRVLTHEKNAGLSAARNTGLDAATGAYIWFVDSDDWCDPTMAETLLAAMTRTDADAAICDFQIVDNDGEPVEGVLPDRPAERRVLTGEEALMFAFDDLAALTVVAWNKLFKTEIWQTERFPVGKGSEDEYAIPLALSRANRVAIISDGLYFYLRRRESLSAMPNPRIPVNYAEAVYWRLARAAELGQTEFAREKYYMWGRALADLTDKGLHKDPKTAADFMDAKRAFRQNYHLRKGLSRGQRLHLAVIYVSPKLHQVLSHAARRIRG